MVYKRFHLLGEEPSVDSNVHMVEIDATHSFEVAQTAIADSFSVLVPSGVGFQYKGKALENVDDILDSDEPISITIDGHAVREIPSPSGFPIIGSYLQIYPDHLGNHERMFAQYGSVIKHTDFGRTTYLTNDPVVANEVFQESPFWSKVINTNHPLWPVKNPEAGLFLSDTNTEAWRQAHKYLPAALSPKAVRHYTPMMQHTAVSAFKVFDHFDEQNEAFNVFTYMFKLASQAVGALAVGEDFHHFDSVDAPLHKMVSSIGEVLLLNKQVSGQPQWLNHLPFGAGAKLRAKSDEFGREVKGACERAQARHKGDPDLPIAEAALVADSIADFAARAIDEKGNKLPTQFLEPAMTVVLGAGFTTTASLMSWMIYCITLHDGVQDRLLQELIDHDINADTQWTFDLTNSLPYLDRFIKEVQRLHNPAHMPSRTALRDQILPGGYKMPKDQVMMNAIHAIHRNSKVWPEPGKFDPDRWGTEACKNRPKGAYVPFAAGPRSCIGFNFALQEVKTVFPTLLYRYEFSRYGDDPIEYDPEFQTIRPMNLYVKCRRRTEWPRKADA